MYNCNEFGGGGEANCIKAESNGEREFCLERLDLPSMLGSPIISSGGRPGNLSSPSSFLNDSGFMRQSPPYNSQSHVEDLGNISCFSSNSLLSSSLFDMSLDLDTMDSSQLRRSLSEYMMENSSLKSEIHEKNRQIIKVKTQVKALLDLETSGILESPDASASLAVITDPRIHTVKQDNDATGNEIVEQGDTDEEEIIRILPQSTYVFIREITSRMDMDQAAIRERMLDGIHVTNQIVIGGLTGWVAAYLLKNFGKTAVTALGGGALILGLANRKGYVDINWIEIYEELQRQSEQRLNASGELEDEPDWTAEKIRNIKLWVNNHSITVGGFVCGFLYKLF